MKQQLEDMIEMYQPNVSQKEQVVYTVGSLEYLSAGALYSGDKPIISRDGKGFFVPLGIEGLAIHDTYKIDGDGNLSESHSTVNLPRNGKVYMPHGLGKPSIKNGSG